MGFLNIKILLYDSRNIDYMVYDLYLILGWGKGIGIIIISVYMVYYII